MRPLNIKKSFEVEFTHNDKYCITIGRDVNMFEITTGKRIWKSHPLSNLSYIAISPNDNFVCVKNTEGKIKLLDTKDGTVINEFISDDKCEGSNIIYSNDGEFIVSGTWEGVINVIDSKNGKILETYDAEKNKMVTHIFKKQNGKTLYTVHQPIAQFDDMPPENNYIIEWAWPLSKLKTKTLSPNFWRVSEIKFSPSEKMVCTIIQNLKTMDFEICVIEFINCNLIWKKTINPSGTNDAVCWSKDGKYLFSVQDNCVIVFESRTGEKISEYDLEYPCDIKCSNNNKLIAIGSWDSGIIMDIDDIINETIS